MSFGQPLLLLTLLVLPAAVGAYMLAQRRRMRYAVRFTNLEVLAQVAGGRSWRRYAPPVLFLAALATLCFGLARPRATMLVAKEQATVILVVDTSGSMQARDVPPTRLEAAKAAVRIFLKHAPDRMRIGLIAFAGEPQIAAPPTRDRALLRRAVDDIGLLTDFGGTAIGDALAAAVEIAPRLPNPRSGAQTISYAASPAPKSEHSLVSILFLSDGSQTRGYLSPLQGADRARNAGIPVFTIALGTPEGVLTPDSGVFRDLGGRSIPVPPDPATLKSIADRTGGRFFEARTVKALQAAYSSLGSHLGREPGRAEVTYAFLAGAAALLLAAGLLSALWAPKLP